jgi:hypothetical protein
MNNLEKSINKKLYQMTYLCEDKSKYATYYGDAVKAITTFAKEWSSARAILEEDWSECWGQYTSNWRGSQTIERQAVLTVGDVSNDYRHKIPTSKAFELVETVNSYLQDAFFPTYNWFDLEPKEYINDDDWETTLRTLTRYIQIKLEEANFQDYWDCFIRQACILGTSVLALPWALVTKDSMKKVLQANGSVKAVPYTKIEQNGFDFEVVDMFDFLIDPSAKEARKGNVIRRIVKTKGEVIRLIESGLFPLGDVETVYNIKEFDEYSSSIVTSTLQKTTQRFHNGLSSVNSDNQKIELFEYWGNLVIGNCEYIDVHAICANECLLVFEPNPYWGGKPFIIGTLINGHGSPYGRGLLDPILGQLHQQYINQNHRLDINELTVNPMWLVADDGSIDPTEVFSEPGKVLLVQDPTKSIGMVQMNATNMNDTVQDEVMLEDKINKATGVGDYVGVNAGRDAERVTAKEVEVRQNAGGNRLGRYHKHLERTALKELLVKAYEFLRQFTDTDTTIVLKKPVSGSMGDAYKYYSVGQSDLVHEIDIIPIGADHVIDKEFELRQHTDFYSFVQGSPQLAQFINWKEVAKDLAKRLIKGDWTKFVLLPNEQDSPGADAATGQSPVDMMAQLQGGGQQGGLPPELMQQGLPPQEPQQPEIDTSKPSYDNAQMQQMLASNPELAQQVTESNVNAKRFLNS